MTIENVNTDLQDLENYLKNAKNKGCNESDLNIILNVLQCPVFKNICNVQNSLKELQRQCSKYPSIDAKNFNITTDGRLELIDVPQDDELSKEELNESSKSNLSEEDEKQFWEYIERSAKGREVVKVKLFKSEKECLGFNVVGLRAEQQIENLGIFVENIAKNGIADREGSLQAGDQILAINREMLDSDICHRKAIEILQNARGNIELIVAKSKCETEAAKSERTSEEYPSDNMLMSEIKKSPSNLSSASLNGTNKFDNQKEIDQHLQNQAGLEKFNHIELIELENTGKGLGFGILGNKNIGVLVKTILPGGVSGKDGRLKSGDHILQINNISLRGMSTDQAAQVLKSAGTHVKLLIARQTSKKLDSHTDQSNFSPLSTRETNIEITKDQSSEETFGSTLEKPKDEENDFEQQTKENESENKVSMINQEDEENELDEQEVESIEVELVKDKKGLGITIAGYVCEKEDISGIYVKSIASGSAADLCQKIQLNDQIIEVDGVSLLEFTNHEAVEVLRNTGKVVKIKLARYLKGDKFGRLQLAINNADFNVVKPLIPSKPNQTILHVNSEQQNRFQDTVDNDSRFKNEKDVIVLNLEKIRNYWQKQLGNDYEIVIASFSKFEEKGGLGISLEGTIEQEIGSEPKPHHYIESILKQGPVGLNDVLRPGDEILQVNNTKIYNLEHNIVVELLKELPLNVCMICARLKDAEKNIINLNEQEKETELNDQNPYEPYISTSNQERLVKAKSDGSLAIVVNSSLELLSKIKSRSLEPLSRLAMWHSNPVIIELQKQDRGLGFSILDYQDPVNPNETVIVIRSLVPGGVASQNSNLMAGDRLLAVNDISLENASLELAVQALKNAPKGIVRLVVAKPLPLSEQQNNADLNYSTLSSTLNNQLNANLNIPTDLIQDANEIEQQSDDKSDTRQDSDWKSVDIDDFEKADYLLKQKHLENFEKSYFNRDDSILINRSRSYSPLSMQFDREELNYTDDLGYTEMPIPIELERLIFLHKRNQSLGVTLELSEQGINGLIVRSLSKKGLIYKDNRIQTGDNLLAINHESLRNTTTSKAKAIFKRVNLVEGQIPIKYVPECEAQCYRRNASFEKSKIQRSSLPCFKQYCRTPSPTNRNTNSSVNPFFN